MKLRNVVVGLCMGVSWLTGMAADAPQAGEEDAKSFIEFGKDFDANCVSLEGVTVLVKSTHPSRPIRLYLERYLLGHFTGDRSKSELLPNGEPERLGCSRTVSGPQEWRILRAEFMDK